MLNNFIPFSKHLNWLDSKGKLSVYLPPMGSIIHLGSDILFSVVLFLSMSFMQVTVLSKRVGKNYTQNLEIPALAFIFSGFLPSISIDYFCLFLFSVVTSQKNCEFSDFFLLTPCGAN